MERKGSGSFGTRFNMDNILTVSKTFNAAQINGMHDTPLQLVAAPGAGFVVVPIALTTAAKTTGHTPFAAGGSITVSIDPTQPECPTDPGVVTGTADALSYSLNTGISGYLLATVANQPVTVTNDTQAFSGGTGSTVTFFLVYELVKL